MQPELAIPAAFLVALIVTAVATSIAIPIAHAMGFMDRPVGYKGHRAATPDLGGAAIVAGVLVAALLFAHDMTGFGVAVGLATAFWAVGTVDDRFNLSPYTRLAVQAGAAVILFEADLGWNVLDHAAADLFLTVFWVIGIVNAVNLMDNMDGSAATTTGISTGGAGAIALLTGADALAALCFAISGACMAFLHYNLLARPSRIFMGDGGSAPLGLLAAFVTMQAAMSSHAGLPAVLIAGLLLGLFILDTTLVVMSRRRRGVTVLTGGRDHLTHRVAIRLGSPLRVAVALGLTQSGLAFLALVGAHDGGQLLALFGSTVVTAGVVALWLLERPPYSATCVEPDPQAAPAPAQA